MTYSRFIFPVLLLALGCGDDSAVDMLDAGNGMSDGGQVDSDIPGSDGGAQDVGGNDGGMAADTNVPDPCADVACGNGVCVEGACQCEAEWSGDTCDEPALELAQRPVLWLDATDDDTITVEDGEVVTWTDKSASRHDFSPTETESRPSLGRIGTRQAIEFDGVDDHLTTSGFSDAGGNAFYTMFIVVNAQADNQIFKGSFLGVDRMLLEDASFGVTYSHQWNTGQSGSFATSAASGYESGDDHIITIQQTNESTSIWIDGEYRAVRDNPGIEALVGALDLTLGAEFGAEDQLNGEVGEVLIFDTAMSFEAREEVERYLGRKWLGSAPEPEVVSLGNISLWLDASDTETLFTSEGHVMTWTSKTGDNVFLPMHDVETDNAPTFVADGINGQPVVRFDGDDELFLPNTQLQGLDDYTVVLIGRYDDDADDGGVLYAVNAMNRPGFRMRMSGLGMRVNHTSPPALSNGDFVELDTAGFGDVFRAITTRSAETMVLHMRTPDDEDMGERAVTQPRLPSMTYVLGGTRADADHTIEQFTGDLAEVIIFRRVIDGQERVILESYLAEKWGL